MTTYSPDFVTNRLNSDTPYLTTRWGKVEIIGTTPTHAITRDRGGIVRVTEYRNLH